MDINDDKNPLEIAFIRLSEDWEYEFSQVIENKTRTEFDTDLKALACMLIAIEHTSYLSRTCQGLIYKCEELCDRRGWDDKLPWTMASDAFNDELYHANVGIDAVITNLDHGNSIMRLWAMEIAWLIRDQIPVEIASQKLFDNVASTLMYVDQAWGLASSLFTDEDDFYQAAENYKPEERYQAQYNDRLQEFKKSTLLCYQVCFWKLESECRKLIQQALERPKQKSLALKR